MQIEGFHPRERSGSFILWLLAVGLIFVAGCSDGTGGANAASADSGGGSDIAPKAPCATLSAKGKPCDDGSACTSGDVCTDVGTCAGTAIACSDGLDCTTDACDPKTGCTFVPIATSCLIDGACVASGTAQVGKPCFTCVPKQNAKAWTADMTQTCDDGDSCTTGDLCQKDGSCKGSAAPCDDSNPCTADQCQPGKGCVSTDITAACDDGDVCTENDQCLGGACKAGLQQKKCDDGDACTADSCVAKQGCASTPDPKACDDGDACTVDVCDAKKGCSHTEMKPGDPCDIGDKCFQGETCDGNLKCGNGTAVDCNDKNLCTTDVCVADKGCLHKFNEMPCDDGIDCSVTDTCTGGACIGIKTGLCPLCEKFFSATVGKLIVFQIGKNGTAGEGIDVDGNPKTCSPADSCADGIDNAASALAFFINKPLIAAVQNGSFSFVAEFQNYQGEGQEFTLNLYQVNMAASSKTTVPPCDGQKDVCEWEVFQAAMTPDCQPKFSFPKATVVGGKLKAGGAGTLFAMDASIMGASNATLYVMGASIQGTVKFGPDGKTIQAIAGVLGGAVPQKTVVDVINSMDDALFAQFGMTKAAALELIKGLLEIDIDTDGDGTPDASSIGLRFSAIGAKITGFQTAP